MIKTAMILSAGAGLRLRPMTLLKPKPLFEVLNKTMLEWWLEAFVSAGIKRVVVNVHYKAELMMQSLGLLGNNYKNHLEIIPSLETEVLGTGGGLKKAAALLGEDDFLVANADIFTDFELVKLCLKQLANPGRLATLGLLDRPELMGEANVSMGEEQRILGFRQSQPFKGEIKRQLYCGVMALSPNIFNYIPDKGYSDIIDVFSKAIAEGADDLSGWTYEPAIWSDMGTPDAYWKLNKHLASGRTVRHSTSIVNGELAGWNVLGAEAMVEKGARVENCVIWPYAVISGGAVVKNAVVAGLVPPGKNLEGGVFCGEAE